MSGRRRRLACSLLLLLAGCALLVGCAKPDRPGPLEGEPVSAGPPVPYTVAFPKDLPPPAAALLPRASRAEQLKDRPPSSALIVRKRAADDVPQLEMALRSLGYYAPRVGYDVAEPSGGGPPGAGPGRGAPLAVSFSVDPGPLFTFEQLQVLVEGEAPGYAPPSPDALGLKRGEPAKAQAVLDAEQTMLTRARKEGYALARLGQRDTVVDRDGHLMDVTLRLAPGRRATFGKITYAGDKGVNGRYLANRTTFEPGQVYDPDQVEKTRQALYDTNLFSTVIVREAEALAPDGSLPITFEVATRAARSLGASLGYQSDVGANGEVFWENRNLAGGGERLRGQIDLSPILQEAQLSFTRPDILRANQDLLASLDLKHEDTDAYESRSLAAGLGVERRFSEQLKGTLGVNYRYLDLKENKEAETSYGLLSLPASVDWDYSNSLLDPTRGGRLTVTTAPFYDTLSSDRQFLKSRLTATRYFELLSQPRLVLAGRLSLGSIFGVGREDVPADERFYAGGGGSVRGIGYQLAGELDDDDKPRGGRSIVELSTEVRYKITDTIGVVAFLDGGAASTSVFPATGEELRWGAGPGLRYFTPIGPLRVDLGFPLQPRSGVDDLFQLYISIGQAF